MAESVAQVQVIGDLVWGLSFDCLEMAGNRLEIVGTGVVFFSAPETIIHGGNPGGDAPAQPQAKTLSNPGHTCRLIRSINASPAARIVFCPVCVAIHEDLCA